MVWLSGGKRKGVLGGCLVNVENVVSDQKQRSEEHNMRKRVCLLVMLLALVIMGFSMDVEAAGIIGRGYCGGEGDGKNLTWTLDSDGVLVIEGQGKMKDWTREESYNLEDMLYDNLSDFQQTAWYKYFDSDRSINDVIGSVIVKGGVTNIGINAFHDCVSLSSIDIPESVTSIGDYAFVGCESLSSIDIPESVKSIGGGLFCDCSNLSSINLPESLTRIGDRAFEGCTSLSSIDIPKSVTRIEDWLFLNCSNLSSINLPESLTRIEYGAFEGCTSLSSIDIPGSVTRIGDYVFCYCESLSSVVIPESLTRIGDRVFEGCASLSSIDIPESIKSIGDWTFAYCFDLSRIHLPKSLTSIGEGAFHSCSNLSSINLPEKLTSIGDRAFEDCYKLSNIVLPDSLTSIGKWEFQYCFNLGSIYIPVRVGTIYRDTFDYTNLKDVYYGGTKEQWTKNIDRWYIGDIGETIHYADDDYEKLNAFVSRLYRNFLKREPDKKGLADWVDILRLGKGTGAKVVAGFVLSPEYKANSLSNEEYVTALYRIIFDREPDAAGLNAWVAVLENGYTNKKVLAGFVNSEEFDNLCRDLGIARGIYKPDEAVNRSNKTAEFVARLYKVCLGRFFEEDGLDNWVRALTYGTVDVYSVVKEFFNSQEFENRCLNDTEFITVAYQTILDREPDVSGLKSWTVVLRWDHTRNQVIDGFLKSTEFDNLCAEYGIKR